MSNLHPNWDDIDSNSREQLIQMLRELEVPYFASATMKELKLILQNRLDPTNKDIQRQVRLIFTESRYKKRTSISIKTIRILLIISIAIIGFFTFNYITRPLPYCTGSEKTGTCRPCPQLAKCSAYKAKCVSGYYLSDLGCYPTRYKKIFALANRGAKFVHRRDGDCLEHKDLLTIENFNILFPDVNTSIYSEFPKFNIKISNGTIKSTKPQVTYVCQVINAMERNPNIVGPIAIIILTILAYTIWKTQHEKDKAIARDLAKLAHKILATADKQIYIYDMKVQLRAKYRSIDRIWKTVVKYIENDSHVIVGVMGARHDTYWKWNHE